MPVAALDVDPAAFSASSRVFGLEIAAPLASAADVLLGSLAGCGGMAGSDDAGRRWASSYDAAAGSAVGAVQDVVNGCYRLAALLEQTGFNHGLAEDASVPGGVRATEDRTPWAGYSQSFAKPPSAAGAGSSGMPPGWSLVEHAVGYVWPNGHRDRLHAASGAWSAMADALDVAAWGVPEALAAISGQRSPEVPDALAACEGMQRHFGDVAGVCAALSTACGEYAGRMDECHSAIGHELVSLAEWTVGIELGGAVLAVVTFGISEAAAQEAEAGRIAQTAARVAALVERLIGAANAAAEYVATLVTRATEVSGRLKPLLRARVAVVDVQFVSRAIERLAGLRARIAGDRLTLAERLDRAPVWLKRKLPQRDGPANGILVKRGADGVVRNYAMYDEDGNIIKRVDLVGRAHGPIPTPHTSEYALHRSPTGASQVREMLVRPATEEEIP